MAPRIVRGSALLALMLAWGCAPAVPTGGGTGGDSSVPRVSGPKRVVAAIRSAPASLARQKTNPAGLVGSVPGLDALEELVHAGVVHLTPNGGLEPQLATAVPTAENGAWRVFPDGRMETTVRLRDDAKWHDGTALTTDDLIFATVVEQDKDLGIPRNPAYDLIEGIEALDARTIIVRWKQPFIEADALFSYSAALPLPKHLIERAYLDDKANFLGIPYWTEEFVGAGPFKMREWAVDAYAILQANPTYVLGRPRIDEVEVRFIADPNTLMANMLAGVEMTIGRALSLDQALQIKEQWRDGGFVVRNAGWANISAQFVNTSPVVIRDLRFRRALLRATDRQQLADVIMAGQSAISHTFVGWDTPEYKAIENRIVKYEFDARRASQEIEALGYVKGADGFFVDGAGQKLGVEIRTTIQNDIHAKTTATVADYWQQVGVAVEQVIIPIQRAQDREYRAQFPGFELIQNGNSLTVRDVRRFHSSSTSLPENRFQNAGNSSRYQNPELDAAIERYLSAIAYADRMDALGAIVNHQTENLPLTGLFFFVTPTMLANRLQNVVARGDRFSESWNAHEWDVK